MKKEQKERIKKKIKDIALITAIVLLLCFVISMGILIGIQKAKDDSLAKQKCLDNKLEFDGTQTINEVLISKCVETMPTGEIIRREFKVK